MLYSGVGDRTEEDTCIEHMCPDWSTEGKSGEGSFECDTHIEFVYNVADCCTPWCLGNINTDLEDL